MIRYRRSPSCKPYKLEIVWNLFIRFVQYPREITNFCVLGVVYSQERNLKELTEIHHQEWILRLPGPDIVRIDRLRALS